MGGNGQGSGVRTTVSDGIHVRVRVQIIRHARTHSVGKYQSCMFLNVGLSVHAPVVCVGWLLSVADRVGG